MKKEEIEVLLAKIQKQREILYNCNDTFNDIKYLQATHVESESERELLNSFVLLYVQMLMWNYLILELHKLFSKSKRDEYRILGVLNILHCGYKDSPFKNTITLVTIKSLLDELQSPAFNMHYQKLNNIRDKYIAHLDRDITELTIQNTDIDYFLKLTERLLNEIIDPMTVGGSGIVFGPPTTFRDLIKEMSKYKGVYDKMEKAIIPGILKSETEKDLLKILGKRNFIIEGIG